MDGIINTCPGNLPGLSGSIFVNLVNTLMASQCALSTENQYPSNYSPDLKEGSSFDYIVVGAGSAGSVVASRLSENPYVTVLLLEAGGRPSVVSEIPNLLFAIQNTDEDWAYRTEPTQQACQSLKNKQCNWPRGKALGGSSAINGMLYLRGNRKDYDDWADLGNRGWDYDSLQKYFVKSENAVTEGHRNTSKHGVGGLLTTNVTKSEHPIRRVIIDGAEELGYGYFEDEVPLGYFDVPTTIENGTRVSASKAFLSRIGVRENLWIATGAQVGKVNIDDKRKVAVGVEVKIGNKIVNLLAKKEVVLSGGTVNSPQILMNSGVGPKEHLEKLGIEVKKNLKVGENLQDHIFYTGYLLGLEDSLVKTTDLAEDTYAYLMRREGPLASVGLLNFIGLINTRKTSQYADVQLHTFFLQKGDVAGVSLLLNSLGFEEEIIKSELDIVKQTSFIKILPTVTKPRSRGRVLLKSKDPYDKPLIYPNYLSDEGDQDVKTLLRGIEYLDSLRKTNAFQKFNITLLRPTIPNCQDLPLGPEFYVCAIRNLATTVYHPVGTCKMGPKRDPDAVVDPKLRVFGIKNLRVIDASIMPTITSINTNAPTIMIGERGAELIKDTWADRRKQKTLRG